MEIAGAVASIVQCLCGECCPNELISKKCSHLRNPQAVVQLLKDKIKLLAAREADLKTKLREEELRRGGEPTSELNLWLDNVQKFKVVQASVEEKIQEKNTLLCGCFPNYYQRLKLGNYVTRKMHEVDNLLEQNIFPGNPLVNIPLKRGSFLPTTAIVGQTAKRILRETWEYIIDNNTGIIGVYGMGGVGKTTLVKEINNDLLRKNTHFDDVIWVTASKDSNVQKLQKDIAKELGLSFNDEDSEITRARDLFENLLRRGRFLLIIDDLWEAFSLENVGIPIPTNTNGCKLLITTRLLTVCRSMETTGEVEVLVLPEEEAWGLFKEKVGEEVFSSPKIVDLAKRVAKECGGLPLALITIGRAMRKEKKINQWQIALSELQNSPESSEGMQNQVFARLRFSYDRLKNDTTRACFQYCALYPEDHLIETEELIKYWVWEGLLRGYGNHIVKMKRGEMILSELKNACLLESVFQDGSSSEYVKMHDLVRDMVIALTRANSTFMVKSGHCLQVPPVDNEWSEDLERVSLMRNDLDALSCEPKCPKLCTLLLQYNSISKGINPTFFEHNLNLQLLDLSYTGIDKLPDSFSNLVNLRTLLLRSCWKLSCVPTLEKLKELKVLDLSFTLIKGMPEGMKMLVNLQYLDLSFTEVFNDPYCLLPHYRFLQCLFLTGTRQFSFGKLFADFLAKYRNLVVLQVNFGNMQDFDHYIASGQWNLLENFSFFVGYPPSFMHTKKNYVGLFWVNICERLSPPWLPGRIFELEICDCSSIKYLPLFITAASSQLQRCKIKSCDKMEYIITPEWSTFPNLEWLEIEGLINLSQLCRGILKANTFSSLKTLNVRSCNNLKTLLPLELVQYLTNLVEIRIEECYKLEEVISEDGEITQVNHSHMVLPNLQKLILSSLPRLKYISRGVMICNSLSSLEVFMCPDLKTLPFLVESREELVDSVKQIKGSRKWWKTIKKNHVNTADLLDHVFKNVPEQSANEEDSEDDSRSSDVPEPLQNLTFSLKNDPTESS